MICVTFFSHLDPRNISIKRQSSPSYHPLPPLFVYINYKSVAAGLEKRYSRREDRQEVYDQLPEESACTHWAVHPAVKGEEYISDLLTKASHHSYNTAKSVVRLNLFSLILYQHSIHTKSTSHSSAVLKLHKLPIKLNQDSFNTNCVGVAVLTMIRLRRF